MHRYPAVSEKRSDDVGAVHDHRRGASVHRGHAPSSGTSSRGQYITAARPGGFIADTGITNNTDEPIDGWQQSGDPGLCNVEHVRPYCAT
ncbi:MAG: hypothetical protein JW940_22030 [Polyangiaceae bacterium]|nr:hypothetical protein [Polyangiaceae bacterium]